MSIDEIRKKIFELGSIINLEKGNQLYPIISDKANVSSDGTTIYIADSKYHYVNMERGQVRKHIESKNVEDILYQIFNSITFSIACDYELKNRKENEDFRRILWNKQLELLNKINKEYAKIRKNEIEQILEISPFKDNK